MAIRADLRAYSQKLAREPDTHGTADHSFIEFQRFVVLGDFKDILGLKGAVQPTILVAITNTVPAFGGDKGRWILWTSMPDTNQLGHPFSPLQFELEWVRPKATPTNDPHMDMRSSQKCLLTLL